MVGIYRCKPSARFCLSAIVLHWLTGGIASRSGRSRFPQLPGHQQGTLHCSWRASRPIGQSGVCRHHQAAVASVGSQREQQIAITLGHSGR